MKKEMLFKIGLVNKSSVQTIKDTTIFYTSDTELWLGFELLETELIFDSAEILLLNKDDRSFVVRSVKQEQGKYWYELESDIIAHHGEWLGQLQFNKDEEAFTSKKFGFRIENDLSNDRPPQLTEVNNWKNLRITADGLIADIRSELDLITKQVSEIEGTETARQQAEQARVSSEEIRKEWFDNSTFKVKNLNPFGKRIELNKYSITEVVDTTGLSVGDKIYATRKFVSVNGTGNIAQGRVVFALTNVINNTTSNSGIGVIDENMTGRLYLYGNATADENGVNLSYFDDLIIINLTKIFGTGNEPSVKEVDELVKIKGYFDGEISLTQKQMFIWLLKITRNNTNAIISMGGTI